MTRCCRSFTKCTRRTRRNKISPEPTAACVPPDRHLYRLSKRSRILLVVLLLIGMVQIDDCSALRGGAGAGGDVSSSDDVVRVLFQGDPPVVAHTDPDDQSTATVHTMARRDRTTNVPCETKKCKRRRRKKKKAKAAAKKKRRRRRQKKQLELLAAGGSETASLNDADSTPRPPTPSAPSASPSVSPSWSQIPSPEPSESPSDIPATDASRATTADSNDGPSDDGNLPPPSLGGGISAKPQWRCSSASAPITMNQCGQPDCFDYDASTGLSKDTNCAQGEECRSASVCEAQRPTFPPAAVAGRSSGGKWDDGMDVHRVRPHVVFTKNK